MTFEQYWRENEAALASEFYRNGKWNVYLLVKAVYERTGAGDVCPRRKIGGKPSASTQESPIERDY